MSDESLRTYVEVLCVREFVRGVRRLTSPRRDSPVLDDVTRDSGVRRVDAWDSGVRRVDAADLDVRVGVVGPECESPSRELEAELRRDSDAGTISVPSTTVDWGRAVVELNNVALGAPEECE